MFIRLGKFILMLATISLIGIILWWCVCDIFSKSTYDNGTFVFKNEVTENYGHIH